MFVLCAFSGNACFRRRRRKLRYASDRFIVARCAVPDRAPSGADRRHRGGQPSFCWRIVVLTRRPSYGSGPPQASDILEVASSTAPRLIYPASIALTKRERKARKASSSCLEKAAKILSSTGAT